MPDIIRIFQHSLIPERYNHAERQQWHQQVSYGEDVGWHWQGHVCLYDHVELHGEGDGVEDGGHDADDDGAREQGAAQTGGEEGHGGGSGAQTNQ